MKKIVVEFEDYDGIVTTILVFEYEKTPEDGTWVVEGVDAEVVREALSKPHGYTTHHNGYMGRVRGVFPERWGWVVSVCRSIADPIPHAVRGPSHFSDMVVRREKDGI